MAARVHALPYFACILLAAWLLFEYAERTGYLEQEQEQEQEANMGAREEDGEPLAVGGGRAGQGEGGAVPEAAGTQLNVSFTVGQLPFNFSRHTAKVLDLDSVGARCESLMPPCPAFAPCSPATLLRDFFETTPKASGAQLNPPHSCTTALEKGTLCPWRDNAVFLLRNFYLTRWGVRFNSDSLMAYHRGCHNPKEEGADPRAGTKVVQYERVVNLLHLYGMKFFHALDETIPLMLDLAPFFNFTPPPPIAVALQQGGVLRSLFDAVGPDARSLQFMDVPDDHILFAKELIQPRWPSCGSIPKMQIRELRRRFYLPPQGLPFFAPGWQVRGGRAFSDEEMEAFPPDWVVLLARRPGQPRAMDKAGDIEAELQRQYGSGHVVVFAKTMPILEAKALFNRAVLLVGPHGAALTNMVFMPSRSFVFEIMPDHYQNTYFKVLAAACNIHYRTTLAKGRKSTGLKLNLPSVLSELQSIAALLLPQLKVLRR